MFLIAMKLMTAIVDIAVTVERAKDNAKRQYESEKSKHQSKKASERLTALQHKKSDVYMIMTNSVNGSYYSINIAEHTSLCNPILFREAHLAVTPTKFLWGFSKEPMLV